jgi:hypothetical protein
LSGLEPETARDLESTRIWGSAAIERSPGES